MLYEAVKRHKLTEAICLQLAICEIWYANNLSIRISRFLNFNSLVVHIKCTSNMAAWFYTICRLQLR